MALAPMPLSSLNSPALRLAARFLNLANQPNQKELRIRPRACRSLASWSTVSPCCTWMATAVPCADAGASSCERP